MSIQEQLAQSQRPSVFPRLFAFEAVPEIGVLGNQSVQMPTNLAGAARSIRISEATTIVATVPASESAEMRWLVRNAREMSNHKGEWLLIQGSELLAHSREFGAVRAVIQDRKILSPFVYYVPTDDESNSVTI